STRAPRSPEPPPAGPRASGSRTREAHFEPTVCSCHHSSVPSPKSLANPTQSSWTMARRDDDDVSRRYFEEEQRSQGPRGPARLARDFGDGTLELQHVMLVATFGEAARVLRGEIAQIMDHRQAAKRERRHRRHPALLQLLS